MKTPPQIEIYFITSSYGLIMASGLAHLINLIKKINDEPLFAFD
jgi:hypothetical protein